MEPDFPDGAAVIFGGSGGIGRGVAMEFAKAGADIAVIYRRKREIAEQLVAEIQALGRKASLHQLDVRQGGEIEQACQAMLAVHGRVHTLVWGAGPLVPQSAIADWSDEQFRQAMEIEVFGFRNAATVLIPHFRQAGGGSFVHLGSAGHDWWPKLDGLSVAPKAANEALIKGIAKEEGQYEIRANSVLVGVIDEKWVQETQKLLALKRWGQAEDVGQAAVFFASRRARYVTGQTISVSGGFGI